MLPRNDQEIMAAFEQFAHEYIDRDGRRFRDSIDDLFAKVDFNQLAQSEEDQKTVDFFGFCLFSSKRFDDLKTVMHRALEVVPENIYYQFYLALGHYCSGETLVALSIGRSIDFSKVIKQATRTYEQEVTCSCPGCGSELSTVDLMDIPLEGSKNGGNDFIQEIFRTIHQLKQANQFEEAIAIYEKLFAQVDGEAPCLLVDLADLYSRTKNLQEAKKAYIRALKGNPGLYQAHRRLAATHRLLDEYELAVGVLKKAHKQFPEDDMILLELAAVYYKLDHLEKAVASLEKALAIDPSIKHSLVNMPDMAHLLNLLQEKRSAMTS
ncbi:MAG: tetratricopeptide repeat protein [Candidatus Heimdallarchaeota archaeon]